MSNKYEVIKHLGKAEYVLLSHMGQSFAFDIETSGLDPHSDRILGLSIYWENGTNIYIVNEHTIDSKPLKDDGTPNTKVYIPVSDMIELVQPLFDQKDLYMVAHNAAFDVKFLNLVGLEIKGRLFDTMLSTKMLDDGTKSVGLKEVAQRELGIQMQHYHALDHYDGFGKDEFLAVPLDDAARYALLDTEATWKLFENHLPRLVDEKLDRAFFSIWMELLPILVDMSLKGIATDLEGIKQFEKEVSEELEEIEKRIFSAGIGMVLSQDPIPPTYLKMVHHVDPDFIDEGQDSWEVMGFTLPLIREGRKKPRIPTFNPSSTSQLGELLYDHMGLQVPSNIFLKANKSGKSTNFDTLQVLMKTYGEKSPPILKDIVQQKKLSKLRSAFLIPLQDWADTSDNNCIRTNFNQHVTDTGRLSSSQPNLQQIPSRGELGARMRGMFVARPDHKLVVADFSNMELRIIAHYSNDEVYRNAFENGEDLHAKTAATQFNIPYDAIVKGNDEGDPEYKQMRAIGKLSNFGLSYGMGAKAFKTRLFVDSGIEVDEDEAGRLIDGYRNTYPDAEKWKARVIQKGYELGYARTMAGRKRRLPALYSSDRFEVMRAERQIPNFCVQGSASEIAAVAMIEMTKLLKPLGAYLLLQVHDEVVVEAPVDKADKAAEIMSYCMGDFVNEKFNLRVPMNADAGVADTWGEAK